MGDEAEGIFEQTHKLGWVRTGLNRPPLRMSDLAIPVRYMPDYLTSRCWVEVQGCGRDKLIRIKDEKLVSLEKWATLGHPVEMFFWDTTNKRHTQIPLPEVLAHVKQMVSGTYPEGKEYYEFPTNLFGWTDWVAPDGENDVT